MLCFEQVRCETFLPRQAGTGPKLKFYEQGLVLEWVWFFCTLRALIKGELESKSEMSAGVGPGCKGSSKTSSPRVMNEKNKN